MTLLHTAASYVGLAFLVFKLIHWLIPYVVASGYRLTRKRLPLCKKWGEWAVVTGASDGLGEAFATELAARNMKVLLVSRDEDRLKAARDRIKEAVARRVPKASAPPTLEILPLNFSASLESSEKTQKAWARLTHFLQQNDIGILINNAGISYPAAEYFDQLPMSLVDDIVAVNLKSTLRLTHAVLPGMRERKRGCILCIGSGSSQLPSQPLYAGYAGVKAALPAFCQSLQVECVKDNILVECQTPMFIATKMSRLSKPSYFVPLPQTFTQLTLDAMENRTPSMFTSSVHVSYFPHVIQLAGAWIIPSALWNTWRLGVSSCIRHRYLSKLKKAP